MQSVNLYRSLYYYYIMNGHARVQNDATPPGTIIADNLKERHKGAADDI